MKKPKAVKCWCQYRREDGRLEQVHDPVVLKAQAMKTLWNCCHLVRATVVPDPPKKRRAKR